MEKEIRKYLENRKSIVEDAIEVMKNEIDFLERHTAKYIAGEDVDVVMRKMEAYKEQVGAKRNILGKLYVRLEEMDNMLIELEKFEK